MFLNNNLIFYDINGNPQAQVFDGVSNVWKFEVSFPEISTGLFSTQQLHIFEKVLNENNEYKITLPKTTNENNFLRFKFRNKNSKFFSYRVNWNSELKDYLVETLTDNKKINLDYDKNRITDKFALEDGQIKNNVPLEKGYLTPTIKKIVSQFDYDLDLINEVENEENISETNSFITESGYRKYIIPENYPQPITFNLGFLSEDDGEFSDILDVYLVDEDNQETKIIELSLYATSVAEDERFVNILENFGQSLDVDDSLVFRETDVYEDLEDNKVLNKKRKELILEYSNIIPYIGSYKGLVNALKFYGYSDLRLKEWWLNTETNQYYHYEIDRETYKTKKDKNSTGAFTKKTGKFSLFYDIFKLTGEVDEYGVPELEKSFPFTQDEVLIKLYGLKELLKRKYLPLSTRIVDITGEGLVFDRISTATWNTLLSISEINNYNISAKIKVDPTINFITNPIGDNYSSLNSTLSSLSNAPLVNINIPLQKIEGLDKGYDHPKRRSYARVNIIDQTFDRVLEDVTSIFDEVGDISFELLESFPVYEVQYDIICNSGKGFKKRIIGKPVDLKEFYVDVDVAGNYDVYIKMYDVYNNVNYTKIENAFSVELPEPNFSGLYISNDKNFHTLNDIGNLSFDDLDVDFFSNKINETKFEDISDLTFDDLTLENYLNRDKYDIYTSLDIINIDREFGYVDIAPNGVNVNDIEKQSFGTFVKSDILNIPPKVVQNTNSEGYVVIDSNVAPEVGSILEILQTILPNTNEPEINLEDRTLIFNEVLFINERTRLYVYNETQNYEFDIVDLVVDNIGNKTIIKVDDLDGVLGVDWSDYIFIRNSVSYEIINVIRQVGNIVRIDLNVGEYDINDFNDGSLYVWWGRNSGLVSVPIRDVQNVGDNLYRIFFNDLENELFLIDKTYKFLFSTYDFINALRYSNKDRFTFEDFGDTPISELDYIEYDNCDLHGTSLCGFTIKDWDGQGRFRIGDDTWFEFGVCDGDIENALSQLRSSDLESFKNYDFISYDDVIYCVCKVPGMETLSIIEFDNLLIEPQINPRFAHNYQLPLVLKQEVNYLSNSKNNRMFWNPLIREWVNYDETCFIDSEVSNPYLFIDGDALGNFQRHYTYPMNSNWRYENLKGGKNTIRVKRFTNVSFADTSNKIIGKNEYYWYVINDYTNEVLYSTKSRRFTYMFDTIGSYTIKLKVVDWNGNTSEVFKEGFVQVL